MPRVQSESSSGLDVFSIINNKVRRAKLKLENTVAGADQKPRLTAERGHRHVQYRASPVIEASLNGMGTVKGRPHGQAPTLNTPGQVPLKRDDQ